MSAQVMPGAGPGGAPVIVINQNAQREEGRKAQLANISAAKAVADIIRTCLGPRAMLKMLLDPMGGIVMTNDGNAILREIDVAHPAAKSMIDLSRALDEEVGDGTTSVIIVAAEFLSVATQFLARNIHPTIIVSAYLKILQDAQTVAEELCFKLDLENEEKVLNVIQSCLGTKFASRWSRTICELALKAVKTVTIERPDATKEIDIKRYAKVEKIPGGEVEQCEVLDGVMFNKDVLTNMSRRIENPRVLLLDQGLEYKKMESQANIEMTGDTDMTKILMQEEDFIKELCDKIIASGANVVVTEKGLSDLAQHFLHKAGISCIRRLRKTDNLRIARACNAKIVHEVDEIQASDLGTECGLFEVKKIGDEYFTFFIECKKPKACTILLRGGSKDVLNEVERNLQDAMNVTRNVCNDPRLVPGGGAFEMAIAEALVEKSKKIEGLEQWPYKAGTQSLEVIPRTIAKNCGANVVRLMTDLRAKHAAEKHATWGVDGITGQVTDIATLGIWDSYSVRMQVMKTAVEAACVILRIDDVVSGIKKKQEGGAGPQPGGSPEEVAERAEMQ